MLSASLQSWGKRIWPLQRFLEHFMSFSKAWGLEMQMSFPEMQPLCLMWLIIYGRTVEQQLAPLRITLSLNFPPPHPLKTNIKSSSTETITRTFLQALSSVRDTHLPVCLPCLSCFKGTKETWQFWLLRVSNQLFQKKFSLSFQYPEISPTHCSPLCYTPHCPPTLSSNLPGIAGGGESWIAIVPLLLRRQPKDIRMKLCSDNRIWSPTQPSGLFPGKPYMSISNTVFNWHLLFAECCEKRKKNPLKNFPSNKRTLL